ncbi:MAG: bifunctional fucokinase/L-fucose-1-P-guanylyltransferase [Lachnospiraceae bacterium]|nr:bifunctional fucokinase/L-fucose-1-P-guanylyltransferase [Lachnospiraceae bacterium]
MTNYTQLYNLFLSQSYKDSWQEYERWLEREEGWDFVVLTASNELQAEGYRQEIQWRRQQGHLPGGCAFVVLSDPDGKRVGSGGATLGVLRSLVTEYGNGTMDSLKGKSVLVIHSGGDSKRIPQYSVCGKLFSPVPRLLPDGRPSTLFDEFLISMAAVAGRVSEGMLVLSGDVLLLFNSLQLDFQYEGAAAISIKTPVEIGQEHGVFLGDGQGMVGRFLHKQPEAVLRELGAVNAQGNVDLDTGAVLLDGNLLKALFGLISTEGKLDDTKFAAFVNDHVRISFYGDFLYPLASKATLEDYLKEAPEGQFSPELEVCRRQIWDAISKFSMKLICLSPARFLHFGTTRELLSLLTEEIEDYRFLDWQAQVGSFVGTKGAAFATYNSLVQEETEIGEGCYIENSLVRAGTKVGRGSILSGVEVTGGYGEIPEGVVLHGVKLHGGTYVNRIYGTSDNSKATAEAGGGFFGQPIEQWLQANDMPITRIWETKEGPHYMWFAKVYPLSIDRKEALRTALLTYRVLSGQAQKEEIRAWISMERVSLYDSFNMANAMDSMQWNQELSEQIAVENFLQVYTNRGTYEESVEGFQSQEMSQKQIRMILAKLEECEQTNYGLAMRGYYGLAKYLRQHKEINVLRSPRDLEDKSFQVLKQAICDVCHEWNLENALKEQKTQIALEESTVQLPVRVNWGGGWTDTPPYCNENGGLVLNAAITLNGIYPVQVTVRRLQEYQVVLASEDVGVQTTITDLETLRDCANPYDHFALHKAALLACKVIPEKGGWFVEEPSLEELLKELGGGIYLSTKVVGVPKGSGLGTSSILAGGCVKAIYQFLGLGIDDYQVYNKVLAMEQMMSTGGGWQDQVGGLCPGIKMIRSNPGLRQELTVSQVILSEETKEKLQQRFALIYTGQRRLARNLLRDVVGGYISGREASLLALSQMKVVAVEMQHALEQGDIDGFAELLNRHWELSLQLDEGATNTCINQILLSCEDLIDGRFIAGAGGGGFLQVILKEGVSHAQLNERLYQVFQDSGVGVWECQFVY